MSHCIGPDCTHESHNRVSDRIFSDRLPASLPTDDELMVEIMGAGDRRAQQCGGNPLLGEVPVPPRSADALMQRPGSSHGRRKSSVLKAALVTASVAGVLAAGCDRMYINPLIHADPASQTNSLPIDRARRGRGKQSPGKGRCACGKKRRNCACR